METAPETIAPAFSGLLPHPPIVVPEVGGERSTDCRSTTDACRAFARRLVAAEPARLFLISPHSPRHVTAFGLWSAPVLHGDLGAFGAAAARVRLANDTALVDRLDAAAQRRGVATWSIPDEPLDHGAVVPLWFLCEAGWDGPTCIASLPWRADAAALSSFGRAAAAALADADGRPALVASGDMTHRALPGAPAGYHARATEFDDAMAERIAAGELERIAEIDPTLRELAAEDAADSSTVVAAAHGFRPHRHQILSYEHPFGVGYLVAVFHDGSES